MNDSLNSSYQLTLLVSNRFENTLNLIVNESSFKFLYETEDKHLNFGSLMLENKSTQQIIVKPDTKESLIVSFVPLKPGLIQLHQIVLKDKLSSKKFIFDCNFNLLID